MSYRGGPRALLGLGLTLGALGCGQEAPDIGEPIGSLEQAAVVCADGPVLQGIDVSYYQDTVDWAAVAADGIDFAVARVNHGDFMDPEFAPNWQGMAENGLIRGAYQYFDPGGDPVDQATVFIDNVGTLGPRDLPGVLDLESTDGLSPAQIAANAKIWLDMVEAGTGRQPIIYTGSYFWNDNVETDEFNDHPLWIAHYQTSCPNLPTVWNRWAIWQYTASGSVAGISGNVDRNEFNGSIEDLNDLAANGYRAQIMDVEPAVSVQPGVTFEVSITLQNTGARAWSEQTFLGTSNERDRQSVFEAASWAADNRVMTTGEVAPGDSVTLTFELTAPMEEGSYVEHFNLLQEGVAWFSDINPGGGPMDDEIALAITVSADGGGTPSSSSGSGATSGAGGGIPNSGDSSGCSVAGAGGSPVGLAPRSIAWGWGALGLALMVLGRRRRRS